MFAAQRRFDEDVRILRAHPGPALCESMLLCAVSGKPFVYDPFNATRLIRLGKLDEAAFTRELRERRYAAVQLRMAPPGDALTHQRFPAAVLQAVQQNYSIVRRSTEGVILLPK